MIKQFIKRVITLNIIFLLIMMLYRIIFTAYFFDFSSLIKIKRDFVLALILGFRFDISVIGWINLLVAILFIVILFINKEDYFIKFISFLKYYYTIVIALIVLIACVDFCFCYYFFDHMCCFLFELFNYKLVYLWYISKNEHNMFAVMFFILVFISSLIFILCKCFFKYNNFIDKIERYNYKIKILVSNFIIVVVLLCVFNIFTIKKDLSLYFSLSQYSYCCELIVCNQYSGIYNIIKEYFNKIDLIKVFGYQKNMKQAFADYFDIKEQDVCDLPKKPLEHKIKYNKNIETIKPNVVLILMESFGTDLLYYDSYKFNLLGELRQHFKEDIVFYNCLFSYRTTQVSSDIIMLGCLSSVQYSTSLKYSPILSNNNFFAFATKPYIENKYKTYNLAEDLLSIPKDSFCVYKGDYDNDELMFEDVFKLVEENDKSKFIFCLTRNNHHPFEIPNNYKYTDIEIPETLDFNEEEILKQLQSYRYSCQKVGEFLTKLKKSKYSDNTIVAIVGDHRARIKEFCDDIIVSRSVPFYLYIPKKLKPAIENIDTTKVVSLVDVMPTLYELSLSSTIYYSMGTNVFDSNYQNAISTEDGNILVVNDKDVCDYDIGRDVINTYKLKRNKEFVECIGIKEKTQKHDKMIKQAKAGVAVSQYILENSKENKE